MIYSKRNLAGGRVRHAAFLPTKGDSGTLETSVCRSANLTHEEIAAIGRRTQRKESLKGWATVTVADVRAVGLEAVATPKYYREHADIIDWPLEESEILLLATELASRSPPPIRL
jgi:hypothetical protein